MWSKIRLLARYIIPSTAAMVVTFAYSIVGGIFVGRGVGMNALAAVNIALPYTVLVMSAGSLMIIGGATVFAIRNGRGDREGANDAFLVSGLPVCAVSVVYSLTGVLFAEKIAALSGASAILVDDTATYIRYYCLFITALILGNWLAVFIRNDNRPGLAFWGMASGAITNVFLDWLFIFPLGMGLKGAAIASGLGQIVSLCILAQHFKGGKTQLWLCPLRLSFPLMGKIVKRGIPELIFQAVKVSNLRLQAK